MKNNRYCIVLALICTLGSASDWPHFRGPEGDGTAPAEELFKGEFGFKLDWKQPLGSGYSAISVAGNTGVTMYTDGTSDLVLAFDTATGKELWRHTLGPMYEGHSGSHDGPMGTPTIDGDMVFAIDTHGVFVALNLADGKLVWSHTLGKDITARVPHYGFNTVPMVVDDKVLVMTGKEKGYTFTAFERSTGKALWHSGEDTSTYQSPFIRRHEGRNRILGVTDQHLLELDPNNGEVLWRGEHKVNDNENYALPVFVGKDKVLILNRRGVAVFQLSWAEGKATMTELWRSKVFQQTYALPVYHEGFVYGFKSQFLHCIEADTGKVRWRSRPPGGQGLILLDGHLVIVGGDGRLVAIEATPEGYREKAQFQLFDEDTYTPASFAHGSLFLRNRKEMARVSITDTPNTAVVAEKGPELKGAFGAFVGKLKESNDKKAMLDQWFASQKSFPIIEKGGLVHFVFRGDVEDIAVTRGFEDEKPLFRVAGTDLFFYSETLDEDSHWSYHFSVFGDRKIDERNPLVFDERNELRMPQWQVPDFLGEPANGTGSVTEISVGEGEAARKVHVYLPAGYQDGDRRYPLLVLPGTNMLEKAGMDRVFDNLIGERTAPFVAAFITLGRPERQNPDPMIDQLVDEILPHLEANYRLLGGPEHRVILGNGVEGVYAAATVARKPGVFGKLAVQSFIFFGDYGKKVKEIFLEQTPAVEAYVVESGNDYKFPGIDAMADSKTLIEMLEGKGVEVSRHSNNGSPGWANWRAQLGKVLAWAFPKQ